MLRLIKRALNTIHQKFHGLVDLILSLDDVEDEFSVLDVVRRRGQLILLPGSHIIGDQLLDVALQTALGSCLCTNLEAHEATQLY